MQLHIKCIFQFCRSPGRAGSWLFRFRSGSALATALAASYQHSLPVNTFICQGPATVAPALVGWRCGWQLRARRPLACRPPGPPSALIGEPNPPGRQPPGTMQARPRRLLQQVPPGSEQPTTLSIQLPAAPVLLLPCAHL